MATFNTDEQDLLHRLERDSQASYTEDEKLNSYYEGVQRLERIGIAVPPDLARFVTVVNWPRVTVEALASRLEVLSLIMPGKETADESLMEGWLANDLDSESHKTHTDAFIYGRSFVAVGTNEEDRDRPLITVEDPRQITVRVDPRKRRVEAALRIYGREETGHHRDPYGTLYLPTKTVYLDRTDGPWQVVDVDEHGLGRVPVVPFFHRLRAGKWVGTSEMADVIPLTDAAARALSNLQIAQETHAVPQRYALGLTKGDFVDKDGKPLPAWEAYFGTIWATANENAKVGQFTASDLRNFHETVKHYALMVSAVTGLSPQQLGFQTDNPASAEGIAAVEATHVRKAEMAQRNFGDQWARVMELYHRMRGGGELPAPKHIRVEWADASTPTVAARAQAAVALFSAGALSREGLWDELGWSEARKARERGYFDAQNADPAFERIAASLEGALNGNGGDGAAGVEELRP